MLQQILPKSFKELPSLRSFPIIGHAYLFLPKGKYQYERLTEAVADISRKLGPIFKLNLGGIQMVITTDADNARILFANEGATPFRPAFPALIHFRKRRFNSVGVVPGNGQEWYRYRREVLPLLRSQLTDSYKPKLRETAKSFIDYIEENRNAKFVLNDIYHHLLKYSIEAISFVSPGMKIQCIIDTHNTFTNQIINANYDFMEGLYETLIELPFWKIYKTRGYKKLESSHETIYGILNGYLQQIRNQFEKEPLSVKSENPFMYHLLSNKNLTQDDIVMLTMEVFLGGIDATTTTTAFTLYHLARNPAVQARARDEAHPEHEEFLSRCVQETLRLCPTGGASARVTTNDTIMNGYRIPKGTLVSVYYSVCSNDPSYFPNSEQYRPQRWMRNTREDFHRFASLPFGYGPRMCPGRRLAMTEIVILVKEILKNYQLEPSNNEPVGMVYRMNRIPDRPIHLKFINIK